MERPEIQSLLLTPSHDLRNFIILSFCFIANSISLILATELHPSHHEHQKSVHLKSLVVQLFDSKETIVHSSQTLCKHNNKLWHTCFNSYLMQHPHSKASENSEPSTKNASRCTKATTHLRYITERLSIQDHVDTTGTQFISSPRTPNTPL